MEYSNKCSNVPKMISSSPQDREIKQYEAGMLTVMSFLTTVFPHRVQHSLDDIVKEIHYSTCASRHPTEWSSDCSSSTPPVSQSPSRATLVEILESSLLNTEPKSDYPLRCFHPTYSLQDEAATC